MIARANGTYRSVFQSARVKGVRRNENKGIDD